MIRAALLRLLASPDLTVALERARQAEDEVHELALRVDALHTLAAFEEVRADVAERDLAFERDATSRLVADLHACEVECLRLRDVAQTAKLQLEIERRQHAEMAAAASGRDAAQRAEIACLRRDLAQARRDVEPAPATQPSARRVEIEGRSAAE